MDGVRVTVEASPPLLDDLLVTLLTGPGVLLCEPTAVLPTVSVVTADHAAGARGRVVIVLSECLSDPAVITIDGRPADAGVTRPAELRQLVIDLAQQLPTCPATAGSAVHSA